MAIIPYAVLPLLVDLPNHPDANIKLRARRVNVNLPDSPGQSCTMDVELIPYRKNADDSYGPELTTGVFTRRLCQPLTVSNNRLVDALTGQILKSRYAADGSLRPFQDWEADVQRIAADTTVQAMYQADWFGKLMEEGLPAPINTFIRDYILLAYSTGDLK